MMNIRFSRVAVGIALAATLAACSAPGQSSDSGATAASEQFPGPWASEMTDMVEHFRSDFAERVFEDGTISEQEFAEAKQMVEECYAAAGLSATWDAYGQVAISGAEGANDEPPQAMGQCSFADGGVMVLYYQMLVNPQHEDDMDLRAQCLVDAGVVEAGFTGQDLRRSYDTESVPWDETNDAAQQCMLDPLGLVEAAS